MVSKWEIGRDRDISEGSGRKLEAAQADKEEFEWCGNERCHNCSFSLTGIEPADIYTP